MTNSYQDNVYGCCNRNCGQFAYIWRKDHLGNNCPNCEKQGIQWTDENEKIKMQIDDLYWSLENKREKITN